MKGGETMYSEVPISAAERTGWIAGVSPVTVCREGAAGGPASVTADGAAAATLREAAAWWTSAERNAVLARLDVLALALLERRLAAGDTDCLKLFYRIKSQLARPPGRRKAYANHKGTKSRRRCCLSWWFKSPGP
jgi:hypothetical protein